MNNYRPISLLSSISKLFEKCIKIRLINFLEKHNILSEKQYGFRNGLSTDDAIIKVTHKIIEELDQGNKCIGIFLDIRKAFDTINHKILIEKLNLLGIRGIVLNLFESYLNNRFQMTKIDDAFSESCDINIGVPQGTVLGPILFLLYINDMLEIDLKKYKGVSYSYADDTVLLFSGKSWEDTYNNSNLGLKIIKNFDLIIKNKDI